MRAKASKRVTPKTTPSRKPDDPGQFKRFVEAARKAGVDETGEAFERAFDKIVPPKKGN